MSLLPLLGAAVVYTGVNQMAQKNLHTPEEVASYRANQAGATGLVLGLGAAALAIAYWPITLLVGGAYALSQDANLREQVGTGVKDAANSVVNMTSWASYQLNRREGETFDQWLGRTSGPRN